MKSQRPLLVTWVYRRLLLTLTLASAASLAQAGRPLAVDDANTNDKGAGHVEMWATQSSVAGDPVVYNVSPAYAPIDGLELAATWSRPNDGTDATSSAQLKWRITESQERGCNFGAVLGMARAPVDVDTTYVIALFSCNAAASGSMHINLGAYKTEGANDSVNTWGVAFEHPMDSVTPHIEWFGEENAEPTVQVGLRGQLTKTLQLDGSIGRTTDVTLYTLGLKIQF